MRIRMIAAVSIAAAATTTGITASAHADNGSQQFQSPSGNITCDLIYYPPGPSVGEGGNSVQCDIGDHTWVAPQPTPPQHHDAIIFRRDASPQVINPPGPFGAYGPTLDYGQTRSAGAITCDSEPSGITCRDSSSDHFFFVSRDPYQLG